jgi:hypothetical protein
MTPYPCLDFKPGGYRYLPSVFQYSAGVAAMPGYRIEQVQFVRPVPLDDAFKFVESHLARIGRPSVAFAHCELRSPRQFDDQGFIDFNRRYVRKLEEWGIYTPEHDGRAAINPVARTNVVPAHQPPAEISMAAFSYTVVDPHDGANSFVLAGGGDARKGPEPYRERIVAFGDVSPAGLRTKVAFVVAEMTRRLASFGLGWQHASAVRAYSVHSISEAVIGELAVPGHIACGLTWHVAHPPVQGLAYEMDVRGRVNVMVLDGGRS